MMTDTQVATQVCVASVVPGRPSTATCSGLPVYRGRGALSRMGTKSRETIYGGSPPIARTTFPTCRAHYPGGSRVSIASPLTRLLPQMAGGSASALSLSRPAQASLTLRPAGLLSRLKRPLSRGSSPSGYPAEPLVSYQINRQLSGWNLPPLMILAFGAHCHQQTCDKRNIASASANSSSGGARGARADRARHYHPMSPHQPLDCLRP